MKKLLGILVLGLLWCNVGFAESCTKYIDMSWKYLASDFTHVSKDENPLYAQFLFKTTSDKGIKIHTVQISTADHRKVHEEEVNIYIKPFGKGNAVMVGLNEINLDVVKTGNYTCTFSEAPKVKKLKKPKKQKSGAKKLLEKIIGN